MEYADVVWDGCYENESNLLESVQYEAAKIVSGAIKGTSMKRLLEDTGWEEMKTRRAIHKILLFYKITNDLTPSYLKSLLKSKTCNRTHYILRGGQNYSQYPVRTERFARSYFPSTTKLWNDISIEIRNAESLSILKLDA